MPTCDEGNRVPRSPLRLLGSHCLSVYVLTHRNCVLVTDSVRCGSRRYFFQVGNRLPHVTYQVIHTSAGTAPGWSHVANSCASLGALPGLPCCSTPVLSGPCYLLQQVSQRVTCVAEEISFVTQLQPFPRSEAFICLSIQSMRSFIHHSNV